MLGEVIPDSNLFHFKSTEIHKRSVEEDNKKAQHGLKYLKPLSRVKRDNLDESVAVSEDICYVSTIGLADRLSRRCVFPFIYNGTLYKECTTEHSSNGAAWCATSLAGDGTVISGDWGDCDLQNISCSRSDLKMNPENVIETSSLEDSPIEEVEELPDSFQFPDTDSSQPLTGTFIPDSRPPFRLPVRPHHDSFGSTGFEIFDAPPPPQNFRLHRPPPPHTPQRLPMGTRILPQGMERFLLLLNPQHDDKHDKEQFEIVQKPTVINEITRKRFSDKEWPSQWYLNRGGELDMNVEEAWDLGYSGRGVTVTILDDGVEWKHPDLMGNYAGEASFDINENDLDPFPRYDLFDTNRHGTRCAGQIAAVANNSFCTVGIAFNARIGGVKMLDGTITDAVEARSLSLNPQFIDIYSASWGPDDDGRTVDGPGPLTRRALEEGVRKGRGGKGSIFVWASGNGGKYQDNCNCDGYATSIYTLSVSSASENGLVPWYSEQCSSTLATTYSSGSSRQGERKVVTTDLHGGCTASHTGTSASSPMAAGIIALVLEANPNLYWRDIQHITVRTAKQANLKAQDWRTNGAGYNVSHAFGFGLMDAGAMVKLAVNWASVPEQKSCEATWAGGIKIPMTQDVQLMIPVQEGCSAVSVLEHVHVKVNINSLSQRGAFSLFLESPSGTISNLLAPRPLDHSVSGFEGFQIWPLMSTHYWGENPTGNWTLTIRNGGERMSRIDEWKLILYGTSNHHNLSIQPSDERN
ncbi:furin-like protease kpc-1 isoform X3 [Eurytemora carolleeae]|nr:furin-like protease kpc-1 isoform X3 [Eurytemora carolleeae]|eukprot:XP_023327170.1 furin-like protease kpc-1 isoform X3 [Eurytemora affinis]